MRSFLAFTLVLGGLASASVPARAVEHGPGVKDGSSLFKATTLSWAEQRIAEIRRKYNLDLFVETVPAAPDADRARVQKMNARDAARYFDDWARERARDAGVEGIYILVCGSPKYIDVAVSAPLPDELFTAADRTRVRSLFIKEISREGPDWALQSTVNRVEEILARHAREAAEGPLGGSVADGFSLAVVILGILGFWLLVTLFRARVARVRPDALERVDLAALQTSLAPGLLGGGSGVLAGLWLFGPSRRGSRIVCHPEESETPAAPVSFSEAPPGEHPLEKHDPSAHPGDG